MRTLAASPVKGTRVRVGFATSGGICVSRLWIPPPPTEERTHTQSRKGTGTVAPHLLRTAACKQAIEKVLSYANSLRQCVYVLCGSVCLSVYSLPEWAKLHFQSGAEDWATIFFFFGGEKRLQTQGKRDASSEFLDDCCGSLPHRRKHRSENSFNMEPKETKTSPRLSIAPLFRRALKHCSVVGAETSHRSEITAPCEVLFNCL